MIVQTLTSITLTHRSSRAFSRSEPVEPLGGAASGLPSATAEEHHVANRQLEALPIFKSQPSHVPSTQDAGVLASADAGGKSAGEVALPKCDIQRFVEGCDDWSRVVITGGVEVVQHPRVLYLRDFSALRDLGVEVLRVSDIQPDYLSQEDRTWAQAARRTFDSPDFFSRKSAEYYVRTASTRTRQTPGGSQGWDVAKRPGGDAWGQAFINNQLSKGSVDPVATLMFPHVLPDPGVAVFHNVAINYLGDLQTQTGTLVFMKGCFDWATQWQDMLQRGGLNTNNLPVHDLVISIVNRHTVGAFYHFLLDGLARLPMVQDLLAKHPTAKVHVVRPVAGSEAWMGREQHRVINFRQQEGFFENFQLPILEVLGFARHRIVTGPIFAGTAYIPEAPACFQHSPVLVHSFRRSLVRGMMRVLPSASLAPPAGMCTVVAIDRSSHAPAGNSGAHSKQAKHIMPRNNRVLSNHRELVAALNAAVRRDNGRAEKANFAKFPEGCAVVEHHEGLTLQQVGTRQRSCSAACDVLVQSRVVDVAHRPIGMHLSLLLSD